MDIDVGTLVYIVLGIIYFIVQAGSKNKKKRQSQSEKTSNDAPKRPERRATFKELLQEFTGQQSTEEEAEEEVLQPEPAMQETRESRPLLTNFEQAKVEAEKRKKKAEEEAKRIRNKFNEHFEEYAIEEQPDISDYQSLFDDPNSARKAFVASEIFKRKF